MKGFREHVLYLDFDGVLHHERVLWHPKVGPYMSAPERYKLFMHVNLLEELLEPYPQILIVLSTSWAKRYGVVHAAKNLSPSLRNRVIGGTWHSRMNSDEFMEKPRGVQIYEDTLRRKPRAWLALDDDYENWPEHCIGNLVLTHGHEGISDSIVLAQFKQKLTQLGA